MDIEFNKVVLELPEVVINTSAASEHVTEVEHKSRVIKEWFRVNLTAIPFRCTPNIMTINLVHFCHFWLNATPLKSGLSEIYSPRELICRQNVDAQKWFKLMFGN